MRLALGRLLVLLPAVASAAAGDLDPSFGTGGVVVSTITGRVGGLGIQPDGRLVVAAGTTVVRYGADGAADPGFGSGGATTTDSVTKALLVEPDGSLVVAGDRCVASTCSATLRRYERDGRLDPTFVADRFIDDPTSASVVARQDDGQLVTGGNAGHAPIFSLWLARDGADGTPDPTFGAAGLVTEGSASHHGASLDALIVDPGGALFVGVSGATAEGVFSSIERFTASGIRDASVDTNFGSPHLSLTPDGRIVAAGTFSTAEQPTPQIRLSRFDADLQPDPTFAPEAAVDGPIGSVRGVLVPPDGKIVVAGAAGDADAARFAVFRWTADGVPDPAFADGGTSAPLTGQTGEAEHVVRQTDGKLVVAGIVGGSSIDGSVVLARFLADSGTPPTTSTTTSTTGAPTTSTTVPTACDGKATFDSIDCRLAALIVEVTSASDMGTGGALLVNQLSHAKVRNDQAETSVVAGETRRARAALRRAMRWMTDFVHRVGSRTGRRQIADATRQRLFDQGKSILADLQALLRAAPSTRRTGSG